MFSKIYPICFVLGVVLCSCSGKKATPEHVALDFYNLLVTVESREKLENDFKFIEGALQIVQEAEPVKYIYKVDESKTVIKNDSAFIQVWTSLDSTTMETLLIKSNENWLVDFNYTPPVDAFNKELINDVLTEMSKYVDTVTVSK